MDTVGSASNALKVSCRRAAGGYVRSPVAKHLSNFAPLDLGDYPQT